MKIVVDCRLLSESDAGIAQYFWPLLIGLMEAKSDDCFYLLTLKKLDVTRLKHLANFHVVSSPRATAEKKGSLLFLSKKLEKIFFDFIHFPRLAKELAPDLLISPYYNLFLPSYFFKRAVFTIHDFCYWDLPLLYPRATRLYYRALFKLAQSKVTSLITVSETTLERLLELYPALRKRSLPIAVVYNSLSLPTPSLDAQFPHLDFGGRIVFVYSSGVDGRKNIERMLQAFQIFCQHRPEILLLFTGPYQENTWLKELINNYALECHVRLTGQLSAEEMAFLYREVACAVINFSLYEGFGRSNLEAKLFNIKLVCSNIPVFREVVGDYPIYVRPDDVEDIVRGLQECLQAARHPKQILESHLSKEKAEEKDHHERFEFSQNLSRFSAAVERAQTIFSVIVTTYNGLELLKRCLKSLEAQTFKNFEVLVCDDGSTDGTSTLIAEYQNAHPSRLHLRHFWQENWGGPAKGRNCGIREARGEWVCFLDNDDWWFPQKLEKMLPHLDRSDVIYHELDIHHPEGHLPGKTTHGRKLKSNRFEDLLVGGNCLANSGTSVRTSLLQVLGGLVENEELKTAAEDYDLWLRLALITPRFTYLKQSLGAYWQGDYNLSAPSEKFINGITSVVQHHLERIANPQLRKEILLRRDYIVARNRQQMVTQSRSLLARDFLRIALKSHQFKLKLKSLAMSLVIQLQLQFQSQSQPLPRSNQQGKNKNGDK